MKSNRSWAASAVLITLCSFSGTVFSDDRDVPVIIITPSSIEQPRQQANTSVTVIDQQTIHNSNSGSVAELLRGHAGLHVADLFGDGSQAAIDLRGFGPTASSNTLVLVDGRRLNNSADGAAPDLTTINLDEIERIEILQGSAGVLYGNQAVGGVINIIRKQVVENKASVSLRAGSYNSSALTADIQRLIGQTQLSLSFSDQQSDNYRAHNDSDRQNFNLRAERQHDSFTAYVEAGITDEHYLTPGALLESEMNVSRTQSLSYYQNDYFDTQSELLRIGMEKALDSDRSVTFDLSRRVNDREFIQTFRPYVGSLTTQDRETTNLSAVYRVVPEITQSYSHLVFGLELESIDYDLLSSIGPQSIEQDVSDVYLSSQWMLGTQSQLDVGFRYSDRKSQIATDDFNDSQAVWTLGYSLTLGDLRLFARADQNFRYPTVEEHTNVPYGQEPGLKTQHGVSLELGTEYLHQDTRYRATLYTIRLQDEIGFDSSGFSNMNIEQTERRGLMLESSHRISESIDMDISLTLVDAEITDGPFAGKRLPLVSERSARIDFSYHHNASLNSSIELLAIDEQVLGGDFANQLEMLPAYTVVNFHMGYQARQWLVNFRINNLLDEEYAETGSQYTEYDMVTFSATNYEAYFPAPERNFWISTKYTF